MVKNKGTSVTRSKSSSTSSVSSSNIKATYSPSILEAQTLGVSKIKSQLRQAKRLLAKDGLTGELKRTTEKKITALQAALEGHPTKEQEKNNAIKYHRIKFFDRQKITRRLKKLLREINQLEDSSPKHQKTAKQLQCLRIDLNYVLHYPKHLKYVSLCPGGDYIAHPSTPLSLGTSVPSSKSPDLLRNYVRAYISQAMDSGTLSSTPETTAIAEAEQDADGLGKDEDPSTNKAALPEADDFFAPGSNL